MIRPVVSWALAAVLALGMCSCTESECSGASQCLRPQLYISACQDPGREAQGEYIGGVRECGIAFGTIGSTEQREVVLTNPGIIDVTFDPSVVQASEQGPVIFSLVGDVAAVIGPGLAATLTIEATIQAVGAGVGTLVVSSDAANFPANSGGLVDVPLTADATL